MPSPPSYALSHAVRSRTKTHSWCRSPRALLARDDDDSFPRIYIYIIVGCVVGLVIITCGVWRWRRSRARRSPPSAAWRTTTHRMPNSAHAYAPTPESPPPTPHRYSVVAGQSLSAAPGFSPANPLYRSPPPADSLTHQYRTPSVAYHPPATSVVHPPPILPAAYPPTTQYDASSFTTPSHAAYPGVFEGGPRQGRASWPSPGVLARPIEPEGTRRSSIMASQPSGDDFTQSLPVAGSSSAPGGSSATTPAFANAMTVGKNGEVVLSLAGSYPSQEKAHADQRRAFSFHDGGGEAGPASVGYLAPNPAVNRMPPSHPEASPPAYEA
jgi:hypothetical protein